ncbi:MAG: hypothetical protein L6V95_06615 [Candidatus Melainabacteria bacterium]|nr:MAG: hypothetical protein L6V95_06615 [Candidatus Melainabacteria bacterium]
MKTVAYLENHQSLDLKNVTLPNSDLSLKLDKVIITSCKELMGVLNDQNFYQDSKNMYLKVKFLKKA